LIRLTHHNLVSNPDVRNWVQNNIPSLLNGVRQDRKDLEDRWYHEWKIWNAELDSQGYMGRVRTYLPAGRSALETWTNSLYAGLFPFSEWFGVQAVEGVGTKRTARSWTNMQRHWINKTMRLKHNMPMALRQYVTLGTTIIKQGWVDEWERMRFFERVLADAPDFDPDDDSMEVLRDEELEETDYDEDPLEFSLAGADGSKIRLVERDMPTKVGPTIRVVDLFHFFVHPRTAPSLQEAELIFEDNITTIEEIESMNTLYMDPRHPEMGMVYDEIEAVVEGQGKVSEDYLESIRERQNKFWANFDPNQLYGKLGKGNVNRSECYWRGEIPNAKDPITNKLYGEQDWLIVLINDCWPVRIHPIPFYNKQRPYRDARMLRVVDEYYGRGVTEAMASLQYVLNDVHNLTLDNITNTLNPIILINEDLVTKAESLRLAPNAKWFVDPAGVQFVTPPNVAAVGLQTIQMLQGFIQDASGASFIAQGQAAPQGRGRAQNTASGMGMLLQQNSQAFQFALSELEEQLMIPMLESNYALAEQFMTEKLPILIGGNRNLPIIQEDVGFEDVFGKYVYTWHGAQGVREQMTLTQQMQSFMQLAMSIRKADPAAQFNVKWPEVLRAFITKGMGLPNAEEWIELPDDEISLKPKEVILMLKSHRPVEAKEGEDHLQALQYLIQAGEMDPQFRIDPKAKDLLETLMYEHVSMFQAEQRAKEEAMMMMAAQAAGGAMGAPPGGGGGMGSMPALGPGGAPPGPAAPTDMMADMARSMQPSSGAM
jgi:hypothetical protein